MAKIYYYDIGDYLSREDKLKKIKDFGYIGNPLMKWTEIEPNEHGDWLNKRSELFNLFTPLEPDKKFNAKAKSVFSTFAIGLASNRDAWVYNYSKSKVARNMSDMIDFYNQQAQAYAVAIKQNPDLQIESFIDTNPAKISWTVNLKKDVERKKQHTYIDDVRYSMYRPFEKQWLYYDKPFIERIGLSPKLFPTPQHKNLVICVSGIGASKDFSALMTDCVPDLQLLFNGQCFPLYWYDESTSDIADLFTQDGKANMDRWVRRDGVTDWVLSTARKQYGSKVTKEDIFYYVYGILHSPDYRATFSADLKKSLPRLPLVEVADDFWAFSRAGRALADLHLNYERAKPYGNCIVLYGAYSDRGGEEMNYRVDKMRFGKKDSKTADKSVIYYNSCITIENIPLEAYDYVVNGKSAIEWIMERYAVTTNKDSGITNDPNDWATEHGDPQYIFNLLLRIITVSVETVKIVNALPKLKFEE